MFQPYMNRRSTSTAKTRYPVRYTMIDLLVSSHMAACFESAIAVDDNTGAGGP